METEETANTENSRQPSSPQPLPTSQDTDAQSALSDGFGRCFTGCVASCSLLSVGENEPLVLRFVLSQLPSTTAASAEFEEPLRKKPRLDSSESTAGAWGALDQVAALRPDSHETTIPLAKLNQPLTCAICMSVFVEPVAMIHCLHRFCRECIVRALRVGQKECPTCRTPCPSKRSLRADPRTKALINVLYPDRESFEAHQQKIIDEVTAATMKNIRLPDGDGRSGPRLSDPQRAFSAARSNGIRRARTRGGGSGAVRRRRRRDESEDDDEDDVDDRDSEDDEPEPPEPSDADDERRAQWAEERARIKAAKEERLEQKRNETRERLSKLQAIPSADDKPKLGEDDDVTFLLYRHPFDTEAASLRKCMVWANARLCVNHLTKFLAQKLPGYAHRTYKLTIDVAGESFVLPREISLLEIYDVYWKRADYMVLYYSVSRAAVL